ncbi:pyrroloquinoline quinone biosynthesis protein PqqE [Rosistilla oblonga]|uniref:Pyrroloquinoline quinone biosynthesis protein PqqE n=3 Tax=Pirellulaceae TaxID=2691357 RepID=A0A518IVJ2_9BACT|nr:MULTISPECIES: radical SAM protein [Rosistilla]QDV57099.1 pyrroloquinoline quinone biosynthesis protein PqqE [Rosistilla oblonga]QDV71380.1 Antilisterial bacteriocin subtilosin biosynthesis protein AlbA [Rosistilla carotiformis]
MYLRMAKRLALETDKRLLWKLFWLMGIKGFRSVHKHKRRLKRGEFFPPFLYMSVINSCNLRCQGCWVDVGAKQSRIEVEAANKTITQAKAMGNSFFGILGGEPFMHKDLMEIFRSHPDAYFQVFTNGHFITDEVAAELHRLGNVTPLISVEGSEIISDQRRGREGVLNQTMEGIKTALRHNLMVGVCTSVCQTNIDDLVNDAWVDRLIEMGVMYCWFHVYRPCGPDANPDLSLSSDQQRRVRQFVVDTRATKPIIVVDAYHDGAGNALCPAVTGFTHHIGPWGDIEPCPIIQLAAETIHDDRPLKDKFNESEFLRDFRHMTAQNTRGCVVMERPDILVQIAEKHGARDTTARGTAIEELKAMQPRRSQYVPGNEIPERNLAYRLAKKFCFSDFGAYDQQAFTQAKWTDPGESPAAERSPSQLPVISSK